MWQSAHDSYLESRILSADPIELTRMLYDAVLGAVRDARSRLAAGEIAARARSISKASAIVIELMSSLDFERGGKISTDLARLYDYILRQLTDANLKQSDALLAEVLGLLTTLSEGWEGVKAQVGTIEHRREEVVAAPARPENSPAQPAAAEEPATSYGNSWSQPVASESVTSYGNSWSQPVASAPAANYGNPWERPAASEPVTSYGNSWERPATTEPVANYTSSWAEPQTREPSSIDWSLPVADRGAAYGSAWSPSAPQEATASTGNPWETRSQEPASPYGNSWVPAEPPPASHDWSL